MDNKEIQEIANQLVNQAKEAAAIFTQFNQEDVDKIVYNAVRAGLKHSAALAKMAHEETGMGVFEDKVIKNLFATEYIYNDIKDLKTCNLINDHTNTGIMEYAEPLGIIFGIVPVTNPTSTVIFKSLLSLKTRNSIIFSASRNAHKCSVEAARIIYEAAIEAGSPDYVIRWIDHPSRDLTQAIMTHPDIALILATGGMGLVHAAYSSGTPAIGVGPGNVPVYIEKSADIKRTINDIIMSKTFDNGMICASEQSVVVDMEIADEVIERFKSQGAYFLTKEEIKRVEAVAIDSEKQSMSPKVVGQSPKKIAELAGITIPDDTKVLIAQLKGVGPEYPLSREKLSPILGFYIVKSLQDGVKLCTDIMHFGGLGHTASISSENPQAIKEFSETINAGRILVNSPSTHGGIGGLYNMIRPSLTLGCGSGGKNITTDNVTVSHLLNIKRVSRRMNPMSCFRLPKEIYFEAGAIDQFFTDEIKKFDIQKAVILCSKEVSLLGISARIEAYLRKTGINALVIPEINEDTLNGYINNSVDFVRKYEPQVIISIGSSQIIDASKIIWLLYEHPEISLDDKDLPFLNINKKVINYPRLGIKAKLIAIPTIKSIGSEVTPTVMTVDNQKGSKSSIIDFSFIPHIAIIDSNLSISVTPNEIAEICIQVLTNAIESYVSVKANDFTDPLSLKAIKLIFDFLPRAYNNCEDSLAIEKIINAKTLTAMACSNAFMGINESISDAMCNEFKLSIAQIKAILISHVIRYNAFSQKKFSPNPKYHFYRATEKYLEIADHLKLDTSTSERGVNNLIAQIEQLREDIKMPKNFKEMGIKLKDFKSKIRKIADASFANPSTGTNPCLPLVDDIENILLDAYGSRE